MIQWEEQDPETAGDSHQNAERMKTLSQDRIVLLAAKTLDWKEFCLKFACRRSSAFSRKTERHQQHKVKNECRENIARCVSHYLDELPPVTSSNMDIS
ncbi:hypothetical protein EYF80_046802 [Liparis tanakae]|uniref:Uncharacterized protein n=1 Tax=Liparis tanakae TaxID=230148 RepID=A0A4Z2FQ16_9TELE|nr:hypothetical protein EYF80_046802 [Liparis tanakae]